MRFALSFYPLRRAALACVDIDIDNMRIVVYRIDAMVLCSLTLCGTNTHIFYYFGLYDGMAVALVVGAHHRQHQNTQNIFIYLEFFSFIFWKMPALHTQWCSLPFHSCSKIDPMGEQPKKRRMAKPGGKKIDTIFSCVRMARERVAIEGNTNAAHIVTVHRHLAFCSHQMEVELLRWNENKNYNWFAPSLV